MVLLFHILAALSSVAYSTFAFFRPSKSRLYTSYGLVAVTLVSGSYLVWQTHARMLQACVTGLAYVGFVGVVIVAAQYKLARVKDK